MDFGKAVGNSSRNCRLEVLNVGVRILFWWHGSLTLLRVLCFAVALSQGGGLYLTSSSSATITSSTISGNSAVSARVVAVEHGFAFFLTPSWLCRALLLRCVDVDVVLL